MPGLHRSGSDLFVAVRNYVKPNSVVWDIGSNLGILTFASAVQVGPNGRVYSLEADPRYADLQTRTLRDLSNEAGKVSILCAAVADKANILDLVIPKKGHARNHLDLVKGNSAGDAEMTKQVVTLTLDWLLEHWSHPNFVKIDVEGAEVLAISGANRLFSEIRPIAYIECAPENVDYMTNFFTSLDYNLFTLNSNGDECPTTHFSFNTLVKPKNRQDDHQ